MNEAREERRDGDGERSLKTSAGSQKPRDRGMEKAQEKDGQNPTRKDLGGAPRFLMRPRMRTVGRLKGENWRSLYHGAKNGGFKLLNTKR